MNVADKISTVVVICLLTAGAATAGPVRIISDQLDYICKLEVMDASGVVSREDIRTHKGVRRGWETAGTDKLCFRRPKYADDCDSKWSSWSCCESTNRLEVECSIH